MGAKRRQNLIDAPNIKYVHPANREFLSNRNHELKAKKEIINNILFQTAQSGCFVMVVLSGFIVSVIIMSFFVIAVIIDSASDSVTFVKLIVFIATIAGLVYTYLLAYSVLLYLYGILRFVYQDKDREKTYQWLVTHGKIAKGKVTYVRKLKSETYIHYKFRVRGLPRSKTYIVTSHASFTTLKNDEQIHVLYNENVSIIL